MSWPLSQEYNEAVQYPADNFADPDLRRGEAVTNALGIPVPRSGNFADVYEVRGPDGGRWAVKCFTRSVPHLRERYQEIGRRLRQARLPFTVDFRYLVEGIHVAGRWRPVLKMEWVEGLTLNQFVAQALDRPAALEALLQIWARMARRLRAAEVAHCDLQHGNVLLVPGAHAHSLALKLIDYDGMWVPSLAQTKSGEVGHPSYQHPQRLREETYSAAVDRFPLLLVATALCALMVGGKPLWEKYDNGDNLLFCEADLREPNQSTLFQDLLALGDPATAALTRRVLTSLDSGLESAPLLEAVMANARRVHRSAARRLTPSCAPAVSAVFDAPRTADTAGAHDGVRPATAEPDPWDFDAGEADSSDAAGSVRPRRRRSRSPIKAYVAVVAVVSAIAAAASFAAWVVWAPHPPGPAAAEAHVAPKEPHTAPTSAPTKVKETSHIDSGVARPPSASAVPPAYPGKVSGFQYPRSHTGPVRVLAVARDGGLGFSLGADKVLYRFHVQDGSEMAPIPLNDDPCAFAVSPDGRRVLTAGGDRRLHLRDLERGTEKPLAGPASAATWVDVSADGKRALSCGEDSTIRLWDLDKGAEARHWPVPLAPPISVVRFSPGGWRAISSGPDHVTRAWDLARQIQTFQILGIDAPDGSGRAPVTAVLFPDGREAAVGMTDGTIDLWDLETREVWKTCPAVGNTATPVGAVAVSPDGRLLASAGGGGPGDPRPGFFIWDLENPAAYPCDTPPVAPECLAFTPDSRHVLAGCIDGTIHCWEITGLKETGSTAGSGSPAVVKKLDPPTNAQAAAAMEEIKKTFRTDYDELDGPEDLHDLAVKHLTEARRTPDQPLRCYALYLEARDLAVQGEDPALGLRIVEEMGQAYEIDVQAAKVDVLRKAGASIRRPGAARAFLDATVPLLKAARADDAYASVAPLLPMVEQACSIAGDSEGSRAASALANEMARLQKDFEDLQIDLQALKAAPDDPDANQVVGEFYCLRKQDWDRGVRFLALGRDKGLAGAAAKDVAAPATPDKQAAVGDAWWDLAKSADSSPALPETREALRRRAYTWYNQALPLLVEKEEKRVADRVADLCQRYPDFPSAWEQLDVSKAVPVGDSFVRLMLGQVISTKEAVAGPVEITVVARVRPAIRSSSAAGGRKSSSSGKLECGRRSCMSAGQSLPNRRSSPTTPAHCRLARIRGTRTPAS